MAHFSTKRSADSEPTQSRRQRRRLRKQCSLETYSVGWIAALEDELTAALAILDEQHTEPEGFMQPENDTNAYHWGQVGFGTQCKNVVIASLPKPYGTSSAATTAKEMTISHPHIRIGLLVGIGAGIPRPQHDVRLGDVVVSQPFGTSSGVIQYDLVKAKELGPELTGHLAPPPPALQKAATSLASQHSLNDSEISEILGTVFENHPKLVKSGLWTYPGREHDVLAGETFYRSAFDVQAAHDGCDADGNLLRPERETSDPEIHFGIIGSGMTLVKDVGERESILRRLPAECLCLDMEAAGLMNTFPCLVIRGISDYGDAHKTDKWQKYAALVASAYAKELLASMTARDVVRTPKVLEVLNENMKKVAQGVSATAAYTSRQRSNAVLDWLCPVNYSSQLNHHLHAHERGTGGWFLQHDTFIAWIQDSGSATLHCPGSPGAGKTVMMSLAIKHLLTTVHHTNRPVAYVYCDYRAEAGQTTLHFLSSILVQIGFLSPAAFTCIYRLYLEHHVRNTRPMIEELQTTLAEACRDLTEVFVVIDALDESKCHKTLVSTIENLRTTTTVKLMCSSRWIPEIATLFCHQRTLWIKGADADIHQYVLHRAQELSPVVHRDSDLLHNVIRRVKEAAAGVFLLARLYVDSLLDAVTANDVLLTLAQMASREDLAAEKAYDIAYQAAIGRVSKNKGRKLKLAQAAFAWVTFARRPLSREELQHALGIDHTGSGLDVPDIDFVVSLCAGLLVYELTIDANMEPVIIVTLVHETVHEYLRRTQPTWYPRSELYFARSCLRYLSLEPSDTSNLDNAWNGHQSEFLYEQGPQGEYNSIQARQLALLGTAFGRYALTFWACHTENALRARLVDDEVSQLEQLVGALFETGGPFFLHACWHVQEETPFHVLVRHNLTIFWDLAMRVSEEPEVQDCQGRTALSRAAELGRTEFARRLLQIPSIDANAQDPGTGFTPLFHAIVHDHTEIAELLMPVADLEIMDGSRLTALIHIFQRQRWKIGRMIFPRVDPILVLKLAVLHKHQWIVELVTQGTYRSRLLAEESREVHWIKLLQLALRNGQRDMFSTLLAFVESTQPCYRDTVRDLYAGLKADLTFRNATAQTAALLDEQHKASQDLKLFTDAEPWILEAGESSSPLYRRALQMQYVVLKRGAENQLISSEDRQQQVDALRYLEEQEPWLRCTSPEP